MPENTLPQYKEQFGPDFDLGFDLSEYDFLVDNSYRHDIGPTFYFFNGERYYILGVDYENVDHREFSQNKRYAVLHAINDGDEENMCIIVASEPAILESESFDVIHDKMEELMGYSLQSSMQP